MKSLLQDVRYGLRMLRKSPGFTAVAVITLALGIGANTAIFSLINAIMLRTLPVRDPQSLVQLNWVSPGEASFHGGSYNYGGCLEEGKTSLETACTFSYPMFEQLNAQRKVFSDVFAFVPIGLTMNFDGRTSRLEGLFVSREFFSTLGAHAALGRLLVSSDDSDNAASAIVVSYRFWQSELGADPSVVGKVIRVNKTPFTVVGVTAPGFLNIDPASLTDFWLPLSAQPMLAPDFPKKTSASPWLELIARLRPGVSPSQAAAAASTVFAAQTIHGPDAVFKPGIVPRIELPIAAHGLGLLRRAFSRPCSHCLPRSQSFWCWHAPISPG